MSAGTVDKKPPPTDSWKAMLEAKPVRNTVAKITRRDSGWTTVTVSTVKPRYLIPPISWIVRPPAERSAHLDKIGSQILELCDGNRTVEEIIDVFSSRHNLTFHEARVSVTNYTKMLVQRGMLAMVMP